jgi:hypothetical protein
MSKGKNKRKQKTVKPDFATAASHKPVAKPKPKVRAKLKMRVCQFCEHEFDAACGRYGCPNCNGVGLGERCIAFMAVKRTPTRTKVRSFPITPTFGVAGPESDMRNVLAEDGAWQGFCLIADGDQITLEPYNA